MFRANRLKRALAERACSGAWLFSGNAAAAEILALEGFDALIIDQEHSPNGIESTIAQMRAISAASNATLLVRVPNIEPHVIKPDLVARGFNFVTVGSDVGFLQAGARAGLASLRS